MIFVFAENEVGRSRGDAWQSCQFLEDEGGDLLHALSLQHHGEVVAARHQIDRRDLIELGDFMGDFVEADAFLRRHLDFDEGASEFIRHLAPIDDRLVADDHPVLAGLCLEGMNLLGG